MNTVLRTLPRTSLWLGFFAVILWAWWVMYQMATSMPDMGIPQAAGALQTPGTMQQTASMPMAPPVISDFGTLFAMWAIMMAAMMGPSFVPTLRTYEDLITSATGTRAGALGLVSGYFMIWIGAAAALAGTQTTLMSSGLLGAMGQSLNLWLSVGLLSAAGLYQFTPLKDRCLAHCRSPMVHFLAHWRPGGLGGLRMGLDHGLWCVTCCWGLMVIGFVGGTMDLRWMGGATVLMTLEKLPDIGRWVTRPVGAGLLTWAAILALGA